MNDERGSWYLLTAILLGIGFGLLYAWVLDPVEFVDTPPRSLQDAYKDEYRAAIAAAFAGTGDLQRAQARLTLLQDDKPALALIAQAQRYIAEGKNQQIAQDLGNLASALGQGPTPLPTRPENTATNEPSPTPTRTTTATRKASATTTPDIAPTLGISVTGAITPTITRTAGPTNTPRPTLTPSVTPTPIPSQTPSPTFAPPFVLENQILVCNPTLSESQIQVFVANAAGVGVSGVEAIITWDGGEEHFFTGLKSDIDLGYSDFVMTPGVRYTLQIADGGQLIPNLQSPECTEDADSPYWGSWRFIFSHP